MELNEGILTLRVIRGEFTKNTELMGKMSPYISFQFGDQKLKTNTVKGGHLTPKFGDEFSLEIKDAGEVLSMRVWDQDLTTSDAIGFAKIKVSSLMINYGIEDWFEISYDNKPSGKIRLSSVFQPKDG